MIFFFLQNIIIAKEKRLVLDLGSKYVKGGVLSSSGKFKLLSPNLYPSSISVAMDDLMEAESAESAVRIGVEAVEKVRKNYLLGIEFFGGIFNKKKPFIKENYEFYSVDQNVTLCEFPLLWYLSQFIHKFKNMTKSTALTVILPGFTTDLTIEEIKAANNNTFSNVEFLKDYEILMKSQTLSSKKKNKNTLYLDFGAFSAKSTLIASSETNTNNFYIKSYDFSEICGIEQTVFRHTNSRNISSTGKCEGNFLEATENYLNDIDTVDQLFEDDLKKLIFGKNNQNQKEEFDEIELVGGGCDYAFVRKTIGKISSKPFVKNLNKFSYLIDLYLKVNKKSTKQKNNKDSKLSPAINNFRFHPLYVKYNSKINAFPGDKNEINLGLFNSQKIKILTDKKHTLNGTSTKIADLEIVNNTVIDDLKDKYVLASINLTSSDLINNVKLCEDDKYIKCSEILVVKKSNSTEVKLAAAYKKASETDAAMTMIRTLIKSFPKKKKSEEL